MLGGWYVMDKILIWGIFVFKIQIGRVTLQWIFVLFS